MGDAKDNTIYAIFDGENSQDDRTCGTAGHLIASNGIGTSIKQICRPPGSNWGPQELQSCALPTELSRPGVNLVSPISTLLIPISNPLMPFIHTPQNNLVPFSNHPLSYPIKYTSHDSSTTIFSIFTF